MNSVVKLYSMCIREQEQMHEQIQPVFSGMMINTKLDVLIVDDSALIIEKIKELLEDLPGIGAVKSCGSCAAAKLLFSHFIPSMILLDINLPGENGIDLLRYVKLNLPGVAVVMVTNQNDYYYKELCLQLGAVDFIDKSKDFERLPGIMETLQ